MRERKKPSDLKNQCCLLPHHNKAYSERRWLKVKQGQLFKQRCGT
jgi:hypothetical protein